MSPVSYGFAPIPVTRDRRTKPTAASSAPDRGTDGDLPSPAKAPPAGTATQGRPFACKGEVLPLIGCTDGSAGGDWCEQFDEPLPRSGTEQGLVPRLPGIVAGMRHTTLTEQ